MMKFALAGNPNSGKTTLFNALTGSSAHVGNWPGVTVDKREGYYRFKNSKEKVNIVDLPGIYSLSPYTPEEVISRNFILDEKPDCIINIIDATNLERNLYLTTQLLEIEVPVIIALNMIDVVKKQGDKIDIAILEEKLGVPVVEVSALKGKGIHEVMDRATKAAKSYRKPMSILEKSNIKDIYGSVYDMLKAKGVKNLVFHTVKLIENDELEASSHPEIVELIDKMKQSIDNDEFFGDYEALVADSRYKYITANLSSANHKAERSSNLSYSDKIDKYLTNRLLGIPLFLLIMFSVFHIIFSGDFLYLSLYGLEPIMSPGVWLQEGMIFLMESFIELVEGWLGNSPEWVIGLICDGILEGLAAIMSFLPQIMLLFLFLSILEDSGYMSRVSFIMDRAFRRFGLSGKAFMPLLMCFGCAVPGIMATRTLEGEKERKLTILLSPFFSCGAKMPIWAVFAATIFLGQGGEFIVFGMYLLGIVVAILAAIVLKNTTLKGEVPLFIMELPSYRMPQVKNTLIHLWNKLKHYLIRAGTIIAGAIVVIWFLSAFSFRLEMVDDSGDSILATISKGIQWIFYPLGFGQGSEGWKFVVATFTGLIAKEMVVATLGVYGGMDGDAVLEMEGDAIVGTGIAALISTMSIPAALAFMAFNLLSVPCMAAVAAANGEFKKGKETFKAIMFWLSTAYIVSAIIYLIGTYWWVSLIIFGVIAVLVLIKYLIKRNNKLHSNPISKAIK